MRKYIFYFLLMAISLPSTAQVADSIFAVKKGKELVIIHTSRAGENVAMLSQRFFVPAESIEKLSMLDGRAKLEPGTIVYVPLLNENFTGARVATGLDYKTPLYYRVVENDNTALISMFANITRNDLIHWNTLHGNTLQEGQTLFLGWVKIVAKDSLSMQNGIAYPSRRPKRIAATTDTSHHVAGALDSVYNVQTNNGVNTIAEKGTAVFFEKAGKNDIFYAFHNTTQRGAVIKIVNPGTGKVIYAKVIGPMPETKLYANCIIGISTPAKEALGITDNKAWCELNYSPN